MVIKVGEVAIDFSLKDQNEKLFTLSENKGKKVLLSFHPLAWTSVCAEQMKRLEERYDKFVELNVEPIGISVDPLPSKKAWAEAIGIKKLRMLSDFWPHGKVALLYGLFMDKFGFSERANILVDENGEVAYVKIYPIKQVPDFDEILEILKEH